MKHGCTVMTLRLSSSRRNGSRQFHRGRKKGIKFAAISSPSWSFFRHPRHCPQGIRIPWWNRQWQVLLWGFEATKGGYSAQTSRQVGKNCWFLHHDKAPAHTSFVVRQFLTSKNITVIPHPPIRLTSPPATFSFSPRWNYGWLRRYTQNRKRLSTHSYLRTSRDAWNHGKHAGIAVYVPEEATSKETVETRSYGEKRFLWSDSPNFWVAPRMCVWTSEWKHSALR